MLFSYFSFEIYASDTLSKMKSLHNQSGGLFVWRHDLTAREQRFARWKSQGMTVWRKESKNGIFV